MRYFLNFVWESRNLDMKCMLSKGLLKKLLYVRAYVL